MTDHKEKLQKAIDELLQAPSPKAEDRLIEDLRPHERSLRQLLERGWSLTKLAKHLKASGIDHSQARIQGAITKIVSESPTPEVKPKKKDKPESEKGTS